MEIKCYDTYPNSREEKEWIIGIEWLFKTKTGFEASVTTDNWQFHIIVGKFQFGNYLCIPNWKVGVELSSWKDTFWNLEQLAGVLKRKNAISIVTAIKYIAEYLEAITE